MIDTEARSPYLHRAAEMSATHDLEPGSAVPKAAFDVAIELVRALPAHLPLPEADIKPGDSVVLDGSAAPRTRFSVSIGASGRLAQVWLFGTDRGHGHVHLDHEQVPRALLHAIGVLQKLERGAIATD